MAKHFTDRANKIVALAEQEARRWNHEYIGTEHILMGLTLEGSGVAANVLRELGVEPDQVRGEIQKLIRNGDQEVKAKRLARTPRAKRALEFADEEAGILGHNYVGTEHLLLGLLREHEGVAAQVLMNLGLELEEVRRKVLELLGKK